jgi:hypothetical protein
MLTKLTADPEFSSRWDESAVAQTHPGISCCRGCWLSGADLKKFFRRLNHEWTLLFVEHRLGDHRLISLIFIYG